MAFDSDYLVDRLRLKRRLTFWRIATIIAVVVAITLGYTRFSDPLGNENFIQNLIAAGGDPKLTRKDGKNSLDIFKMFHSKPFPTK